MILKDTFFTIESQNIKEEKAKFRIKLHAEHFIYQAHFPNNPITPGVCLIQMAVEPFSLLKGANFSIKSLKNVKFTAPINPLEFPEVDFILESAKNDDHWLIKVLIMEKEKAFAKMSLLLDENLCNNSGL